MIFHENVYLFNMQIISRTFSNKNNFALEIKGYGMKSSKELQFWQIRDWIDEIKGV